MRGRGHVVTGDLATGKAHPVESNFMRFLDFDAAGNLLTVHSNGEILIRIPLTGAKLKSMDGRSFAGNFLVVNPDPAANVFKTDNACGAPPGYTGFTQLWDATEGVEIGVGFPFTCASWSPDGKYIVGNDSTSIYLWSIDPENWKEAACRGRSPDILLACSAAC